MNKAKYWLATTSALLLMSGAAMAQSSSMSSETVTVSPGAPPVADSYSASKSSRTVDAYGNEIDRSKSVERHQTADGESVTRQSSESTSSASVPMPPPPPVSSSVTTTTTTHTDE
jgi:hypothetical protein